MQKDVITVPIDMSVREVIRVMADNEISGVPVIDESKNAAGVISASDIVRLAASELEIPAGEAMLDMASQENELPEPQEDESGEPRAYFVYPDTSPLLVVPRMQRLAVSGFDEMTAADIMTPAAYSVSPDVTIWEMARFLVKSRIHRALVVEDHRLVGIVTSFDVLRVVAGDAEATTEVRG